MSIEEAIRNTLEASGKRGIAALDDLWHPDIEYREAPDFPGAGTYRGIDAVRARFQEYVDILGDVEAAVEQVTVKGDRAAWTVRYSGTTAGGLPHSHAWGYVGRFEDGLLAECDAYYDAADAWAAL